jgi:autotransporter passenger strand-loop-strand repeat protein
MSTTVTSGETVTISSGQNDGSATVLSGGTLIISSGGTETGATIDGGGVEIVAGGTARATIVETDGIMAVSSGGTGSGTIVNFGGFEVVSSGGLDVGGTIAGEQDVYGSAGVETIAAGGLQVVESGGTGGANTIEGGGSVLVMSGGTVANSFVQDGGVFEIASGGTLGNVQFDLLGHGILKIDGTTTSQFGVGVSISGFANGHGAIDLADVAFNSAGTLTSSPITSSFGTLIVSEGGSHYELTLSGSAGPVFALNSDGDGGTLVNAGEFLVSGGHVTTVSSGETDSGGIVLNGGTLVVDSRGSAAFPTIESGGTVLISSGGTANATAVNPGGSETVLHGGAASGTAIGFGGVETVASGGTDFGATVGSGGSELVMSGGTAGFAVVSGGVLEVASGGTLFGVNFSGSISPAVTFAGIGGVLKIDGTPPSGPSAAFGGVYFGSSLGASIDLTAVRFDPTGTAGLGGPSGQDLTVTENGKTYDLGRTDVSGLPNQTGAPALYGFALESDGTGGTRIVPTFAATNELQLDEAILTADSAPGHYAIQLLPGGPPPLPGQVLPEGPQPGQVIAVDGQIVPAPPEPYAINLKGGDLLIDGEKDALDGGGAYRGLFVYSGNVTIENLTIQNMRALGGAGGGGSSGGGGGGGAGFGGGLFVGSSGHVSLDNVTFSNDTATGGAGGPGAGLLSLGQGGGGGLGGAGGDGGSAGGGGGGIGSTAVGASSSNTAGGTGIVPGAATVSGTASFGGGGAAQSGGGIKATPGIAGGFGGGGGGGLGTAGGPGGFGGGGGGGADGGGGANASGGFGAGNGGGGGGGGLGAGGDIFVQQGGLLTIEGGSLSGGAANGGTGASGGGNGSGFGAGIFIQGNQTIALAPTSGQTVTISDEIADQTGSYLNAGLGTPTGSSADGTANAGAGRVSISGGGTVVLSGDNTYTGGTTVSGAGTILSLSADDNLGYGSGTLTLDPGTTLDFTAATTIAHPIKVAGDPSFDVPAGQTDTISGVISDGATRGTVELIGGGTLVLDAHNTYTGGTTITGGSTLELGFSNAAGTGSITFTGSDDTLKIAGTTMPANTISGFAQTDTIDLAGVAFDPGAAGPVLNPTTHRLTFTEGGTQYALQLDPAQSFAGKFFHLASDGASGTAIIENNIETVTTAGSGLVFDNTYSSSVTAAYRSDILAAEHVLASEYTNSVTLDMNFNFAPLGPDSTSESSFNTVDVTYATLKSALQSHATTPLQQAAVAALPATDPSGGALFAVPIGMADILGIAGGATGTDDVTLNSSLSWTFGQDVVGEIEHQISEGAMGRIGSLGFAIPGEWAPMDLFRYSAVDTPDYTGGQDGQETFFSVDGSSLSTQNFHNSVDSSGQFDGLDLADWDSTVGDSFGPGGPGIGATLSTTDLQIMEVLGWDLQAAWKRHCFGQLE